MLSCLVEASTRASHPCTRTDVGALALKVPGRACCLAASVSCGDVEGGAARTAVTGPRGRAKAFQPRNSSISFSKAFKKNCYQQPLEQELHSPCVYCKGWSDVWKVCAAFHFKHKEVLFLCGS